MVHLVYVCTLVATNLFFFFFFFCWIFQRACACVYVTIRKWMNVNGQTMRWWWRWCWCKVYKYELDLLIQQHWMLNKRLWLVEQVRWSDSSSALIVNFLSFFQHVDFIFVLHLHLCRFSNRWLNIVLLWFAFLIASFVFFLFSKFRAKKSSKSFEEKIRLNQKTIWSSWHL